MAVMDGATLGGVAGLLARLREGRGRRDATMSTSQLLGRVHEDAAGRIPIGPEDNVLLLGAGDLRPVERIASACRALMILDDLPEGRMTALGAEPRFRAFQNIRFRQWRSGGIPAPQGTMDRILSLSYLYRSRDALAVAGELVWSGHHGCAVVVCEPSATLDDRTARKYSREAELSMEEHAALLAYTRSATSMRRFSREGLASLLTRSGMKDVEVGELLHGLILVATARVEF